jgi:hypothetical protein
MTPAHLHLDAWRYVFNSPLECGLRAVAVLLEAYPAKFDLQRLVYYDYLLVHSGDIEGGPPSIHPAVPHRSGEIVVRRKLVRQGLDFMMLKSLVCRDFAETGIVYYAGDDAAPFVDMLTTPYVQQLRERAIWLVSQLRDLSEVELSRFIQENWSRWGTEFVYESLYREGDEE